MSTPTSPIKFTVEELKRLQDLNTRLGLGDLAFANRDRPPHDAWVRPVFKLPVSPLSNDELAASTPPTYSLKDLELPEDIKEFHRLQTDITRDIMRKVEEAFIAGAPFVSLTSNGHEISRIYADGRSTLCNLDVPRSWEWPHTS